jgi:DNA mismatch endonuclease (patch repair protein)
LKRPLSSRLRTPRTLAATSEIMRRIRKKDTRPEMTVRKVLHGLGYRYRLHDASLPGTPDLVFRSRRKAILVHGCFWHQHGCALTRLPKSNLDYWLPKLKRNQQRDKVTRSAMRRDGWKILVVWECQSRNQAITKRLVDFLEGRSKKGKRWPS